jgi:hypothetical protein
MTVPTVPPTAQPPEGVDERPGRGWTIGAFLAPLGYLLWLVVMFVAGYWVTGLFDFEPGQGENFADQGTAEWFANAAYFVVVAVPNWIGAGLAAKARALGAGTPALVALVLNVVMGAAIALAGTLTGGL